MKTKTSLIGIVQKYVEHHRPQTQTEMDCFKNLSSLEEAIEHAGLAITGDGKRFGHQRRLKRAVLEKAKERLLRNKAEIEKCKSFDDLFALIEILTQPIEGIGELYVYDTSFRIGVFLNLYPERVYLHAGTRTGAGYLGLDTEAKFLERSVFPPEFDQLEPFEIEDVLCIFKDELKALGEGKDLLPGIQKRGCG